MLHEAARGVPDSNWGPPMSYAANVGQDGIIQMLREMGAQDLQHAFDRACLQGQIQTARRLYEMGARPAPGCVMGPCETLNDAGLALLLEMGAELADASGDPLAPVALLLETYCRYPEGKHRCLELAASRGVALPDTPVMALHRGRVDLLKEHLRRDPGLAARTFSHEEIYPPTLGCHADHSLALHGTPLAGTTLLHICVDFDEIEIARWLIDHGADVNAKAEVDSDGFGGHTPLFGCVVSQSYLCRRQRDADIRPFAAGSWRRSQCAGIAPEAVAICPGRDYARVSRHHAAGVGGTVPRSGITWSHLDQQGGDGVDRGTGRPFITGSQQSGRRQDHPHLSRAYAAC